MRTNSATVHNVRRTSSVSDNNDKVEYQHLIHNVQLI